MMSMRNGSFELPPKPAVHPRSDTFIHAMPTYLADPDIAALKWIGGSSRNRRNAGFHTYRGLSTSTIRTPPRRSNLYAAEITAARTAALTALCIRRLARGASKIAIVGLGVQGRAHEKMFESIEPEAEVTAVDATYAPDSTELRGAIEQADVVITAIRMERPARPFIKAEWLVDCQLIVPVDFDAAIEAAVVSNADRFLVDHVPTYEYYRTLDYFRGWPHARLTLADALAAPDTTGRTVCCNLGAATLDATFAKAVIEKSDRGRRRPDAAVAVTGGCMSARPARRVQGLASFPPSRSVGSRGSLKSCSFKCFSRRGGPLSTEHEFPDTHVHFKWDVGNEPALSVQSGDSVTLESRDVSDNQLTPELDVERHRDARLGSRLSARRTDRGRGCGAWRHARGRDPRAAHPGLGLDGDHPRARAAARRLRVGVLARVRPHRWRARVHPGGRRDPDRAVLRDDGRLPERRAATRR